MRRRRRATLLSSAGSEPQLVVPHRPASWAERAHASLTSLSRLLTVAAIASTQEAKRAGHIIARVCAVIGGVLLIASAAFAYFIAGYADDAIDAGTGVAEDALRSNRAGLDDRTAADATDWLHRLSDWAISGRPGEFRTYALVAVAAGFVGIVTALPRRPESVWPEIAWALAALGGLAPNIPSTCGSRSGCSPEAWWRRPRSSTFSPGATIMSSEPGR